MIYRDLSRRGVLCSKNFLRKSDFPSENILCLMSLNHGKFQLGVINVFLHFVLLPYQTNVVLIPGGFSALPYYLFFLPYLTDSVRSARAAIRTFIPVSVVALEQLYIPFSCSFCFLFENEHQQKIPNQKPRSV